MSTDDTNWDDTADEQHFVQRPYIHIPPDPRDEADYLSIFNFFGKHPVWADDGRRPRGSNEVDEQYVAALRGTFPDVGAIVSAFEVPPVPPVTRYKVTIFGLEVIYCGRVLVGDEYGCGYSPAVVVRLPDGDTFDILGPYSLAELRAKLNQMAEWSPDDNGSRQ